MEISICRINSTNNYSDGYINTSPIMNGVNQFLNIGYQINQNIIGNGSASINILCKPNGGDTYLPYCQFGLSSPLTCSNLSGTFRMNYGDSLCYNNKLSINTVGSCSSFYICNPTASSDINPSINSLKSIDCLKA